MLLPASLAFRNIAREENDDRVKFLTCQSTDPILWVVGSRCADNLGSGRHALAELLGKRSERSLVDPKSSQTFPRKPYRYPSRSGVL